MSQNTGAFRIGKFLANAVVLMMFGLFTGLAIGVAVKSYHWVADTSCEAK